MTTGDRVVSYLESLQWVKIKLRGEELQGNNPFKSGSDSFGFRLKIEPGGEHGAWYDHSTDESGSLYDLAQRLGIELPERADIDNSKREYQGLGDYAEQHGIPGDYLMAKGWSEITKDNRPCLQFKTACGVRYRFLDNQKPSYKSVYGYTACWYGLDKAIFQNDSGYIVLCNGEISTLTAHYYNVPAFAATSGEKAIPDGLLHELNEKWQGRIIIAMDCDEKGRNVAQQMNEQLPNSVVIDLSLSDKGDLADYCKLHNNDSFADLLQIAQMQPEQEQVAINPYETPVNRSDNVLNALSDEIYGRIAVKERAFPFPIQSLHQFGGFMKNCITGKVTLIAGGTGYGKTQFLETCTDRLNAQFINGLWWGGEWSKKEMMMRRVQRYSQEPRHVTYDMIQEHLTYLGYKQDGVDDSQNFGAELYGGHLAEYDRVCELLNNWVGTTEYYEGRSTVEETFVDMQFTIERERAEGRMILFVVFDYVQLVRAQSWDSSTNRYEYAFELIKEFAIQNNVHVFMTSQVNKNASSDKSAGLSTESAHYIRGDKANLFLILDRKFYQDKNDNWIDTNAFWLNVGKASMGGVYADYNDGIMRVPLVMNPSHLFFNERDWRDDNQFSMLPEYGG